MPLKTIGQLVSIIVGAAVVYPLTAAIPEDLSVKMEFELNARLDKAVESIVDEEKICLEAWCQWPLVAPKRDVPIIEQQINQKTEELAFQKYPTSLVKSYKKTARARFRQYEPGEQVTLTTKAGTKVTGLLRRFDPKFVLVDNEEVRMGALSEDDQAHFNPKLAKTKIEQYVRSETAALKKTRIQYRRSLREEVERQHYVDAGYIMVYGKWTPIQQFVEKKIIARRQQVRDQLEPLARIAIYYENGLVFYSDEWMTREEAEERKRAAEAAAAGGQTATEAVTTETAPSETATTPEETTNESESVDDGLWD